MTNHPACPNIPLLTQITRLRFLRGHSLLSSLKLHPAQFHLLAMLHHDEGMSQAEIAGKLMVKPSTLTVMVRRMMKNGLVERKQDVLDGRVQRVYCTEKGVRLLLQAQQLFAQIEQETLDGFTVEERSQFETLATKIRDNLARAIDGEDQSCQWF